MKYIIIPLVGFSNGLIVGSGIVALLTLIDIIPRLAQLSNTYEKIRLYENIIIIGSLVGSIASLTGIIFNLGKLTVILFGLGMGIFVGLLASALAEVLNVVPVLIRRFKLEGYVVYIVYSMMIGKVLGSLIDWFL